MLSCVSNFWEYSKFQAQNLKSHAQILKSHSQILKSHAQNLSMGLENLRVEQYLSKNNFTVEL